MSWKRWKLGLFVAVLSAVCDGALVSIVDPTIAWKALGILFIVWVAKGAGMFLKNHPVETIMDDTQVITKTLGLILLSSIFVGYGCAHIAPGSDPLIVRAEQVEHAAASSFDLVLQLDNSRRAFFRTNAPEFHRVAEWLREPQNVGGTNYPRAVALVLNVNSVKATYRDNRSNSNLLSIVVTTLESAALQASDAIKTQNSK